MQPISENQLKMQNTYEDSHIDDAIDVQIYDNFKVLEKMQQEWDNFTEKMSAEVYLTYDWCSVWWKYYGKGRDLKIFIFRQSTRIVGILPIFRETIGIWPVSIGVIKIVGTDFCPITLSIPLKKDILDVLVKCFLNEIEKICSWDIIYLGAICGRYDVLEQLQQSFKDILIDSHQIMNKTTDVQTYFQIANNWEEQIATTLSQKQRNKTRREFKEIQTRGLSLTFVKATSETFTSLFEDFVEMHQKQWQLRGMPGHFVDWPSAYEFHKELAQAQLSRDRLRLLQIKLGDHVIGYEYLYRHGNTYQWYLGARTGLENEQHVHFYRLAFKIKVESALNDNVRCIDAGRGQYDYKVEMGGKQFPVHSIFISSKKYFCAIKINIFMRMVWLTNIVYMKILRKRIAPRFGIRIGAFWKWWAKTHMLSN